MSDNFLSRWSRRKLEVREQEKLADTSALKGEPPVVADLREIAVEPVPAATTPAVAPVTQPQAPLPTDADLHQVEQGGDIKAFLVDKVSPGLKNKAFKALFSRPEFNVMDGLDIYIDDYNKFMPLSQEDIGKMSLSRQLLSRPDLELPKAIEENEEQQNLETVQEQALPAEQLEQRESEIAQDLREVPDALQAADSQQASVEHSFEKPPLSAP